MIRETFQQISSISIANAFTKSLLENHLDGSKHHTLDVSDLPAKDI